MIKLIFFLISLIVLSTGAYWLSENSGNLVFNLLGYEVETTVTYAVISLVCFIILLQSFFLLIYKITDLPKFFANRKRDNLIQLLSELLIAVKIDDEENAHKISKRLLRLKVSERVQNVLLLIGNAKNKINNFTQLTNLTKYEDIRSGAYKKLIESYLESGNWQVASNYCQELWQVEKSDWLLIACIKGYVGNKKWQELLSFLENIGWLHRLNNKLVKVFIAISQFKIAQKWFYEELYSQAEELIEKAHNALPEFLPISHLFVEVLIKRKKYHEAFDLIQEQWQYLPHPAFTRLVFLLADFFNAEEYITLVKKVVDDCQQHYESHLLLAEAAINSDQFDFASKQLGEVLDYQNNFRACLLMLKFCLRTHGNSSEALDWLKRAIKSGDNLQVKHYYWDFEKMDWSMISTPSSLYITSF